VILHEMRPVRATEVHKTDGLAELVCSNSFRSDDYENSAVGLLHEEMRRAGSLIMAAADANKVPAGSALAVDRDGFSDRVSEEIGRHDLITIKRGEVAGLPPPDWTHVIIATGPLTSPALSAAIRELTGEAELAFFDAIAPIVYKDTIDFDICWYQSRYDKAGPGGSGADYINCPLNEAQYHQFIGAVLEAETVAFHDWEGTPYFEGCLPIEIMAERGVEVLRHGPMKPVGLTNPHAPDVKSHAVVQLRQDNALGTLYNMVGFQTKMKYGAQNEVLRLIPGLENAQFARLGGLHRNTFLNSPKVLTKDMRLSADKRLRFAGQITGVEGYVESAAMGLLAGRFAVSEIQNRELPPPPATSALGALLAHITGGHIADEQDGARSFQPMNINFGLFPDIAAEGRGRKQRRLARRHALSARALGDVEDWLDGFGLAAQ
jgi:methylenetetrahydrofolate--tRNA-(uracil-5-)-methyltransferase